MKRRNFLQLAAATGLTLGLPGRTINAQSEAFAGPFWVQVNAGGAWDPTLLFNPVADLMQSRKYTDIATVGNISYANVPIDAMAFGLDPMAGYEVNLMVERAVSHQVGREPDGDQRHRYLHQQPRRG